MKFVKARPVAAIIGAGVVLGLFTISAFSVQTQSGTSDSSRSSTSAGNCPNPKVAYERPGNPKVATEAPTSFDPNNDNNGLLSDADFVAARAVFDSVELFGDGLGPTYNAQSCRECHQNVISGGDSQVTEVRSTRLTAGVYFESLGGSIIQARATFPNIVEHVGATDNIRTERNSLQLLGDGFVECISNNTLLALAEAQPSSMRGVPAIVPVLEASNPPVAMKNFRQADNMRIGRFGWKAEHASLISFSGDAYLNEMGITNPLFIDENLSDGRYVGWGTRYDPLPEPEDNGEDVQLFADFMRSTKAPSRGTITKSVSCGEQLFDQIGCATCHTPSIVTAPPGTVINAGAFTVPSALGNKIIHPYSDFLLHDIGTSDGIPIQPIPEYYYTANVMRTPPLWGLRTRNRLFHDSLPLTLTEAIDRHSNQALKARSNYYALSASKRQSVIDFLNSL